jgi:sorbitol/mannitol transport system permease protein
MTTTRTPVHTLLTLLTYALTLLMFFPILWMVLTSFKTEATAYAFPPQLFFEPTLSSWQIALIDEPYMRYLGNTIVIAVGSTAIALALGVPAAYGLAYYPGRRSGFILTWMIGTRMLPPAGVILPLYIIFRDSSLLDTHLGMIFIYTAMNLPLVVWMMRSFFLDVPYEIIEASRIDGAGFWGEFRRVAMPLVLPGLTSTTLLCLIFAWNEFFFAFNLTTTNAAPLSVYISTFKTSEGLFWAKMSAAATATVLPIVIAGWVAQRQLVKGLTLGAVK